MGDSSRRQRHRRVGDVDQHPHPIADIEAAGHLRNVGGGVAVAEECLQLGKTFLGHHLAVAVLVEAVDHDPVIAGQVAKDPRRVVAQAAQGCRGQDRFQPQLRIAREIDGRPCLFELDHQPGIGGAVQHAVEFLIAWANPAAHRHRQRVQRLGQPRPDFRGEGARQGREGPAEEPAPQAEETRCVGACLDDREVGFADRQQCAARLDRAGQVDLFEFTIGEIGLSESRSKPESPN